MSEQNLTLITRNGCHLCMDMEIEVDIWCTDHGWTWSALDVDNDDKLLAQYNLDVPVLLHRQTVVCKHVFDASALARLKDQ